MDLAFSPINRTFEHVQEVARFKEWPGISTAMVSEECSVGIQAHTYKQSMEILCFIILHYKYINVYFALT